MSYPTGGNIQTRLGYVVSGQWQSATVQKIGQSQATTGLFTKDLYETSGNELELIYSNYIETDLKDLAQAYVSYKYGNPDPTDPDEIILFKYKSTLILDYFNNNKQEILKAIKPIRKISGTGYVYLSGDKKDKATAQFDTWTNQTAKPSIISLLASYPRPLNPSDEIIHELILNAFGLTTWLKDQNIPGVQGQGGAGALEAITTSNQAALNALKAATLATIGQQNVVTPDPEQQRSLDQCALITDLLHGGYSKLYYPTVWDSIRTGTAAGTQKRTGKDNNAFGGRIYPVRTDNFNPDNLVNMCTMPNNVNSWLNDSSATDSTSIQWDLFWVYKTSKGINETLITPNTKDASGASSLLSTLTKQNIVDQNTAIELEQDIKAIWRQYELKSATVKFDGTNPSTARNDVKVDLTFELGSIAALDAACAYLVLETVDQAPKTAANPAGPPKPTSMSTTLTEVVTLKLYDLVTAPVTSTFESEVIAPTNTLQTTREFKPDYSRIRLKARAVGAASEMPNADLILDLSTVGHTVNRSAADGKVSFTINYRGYFEESLSAPYNDALADQNIINSRIARALRVIDAKNNKCSDQLIRDLVRLNQEEERIEVQDYHDKGGLIKRIYDEGIIYNYTIDQSKYNLGVAGTVLDPRLNYISSISPFNNAQQAAANATARANAAALNNRISTAQQAANRASMAMGGGGIQAPPPSSTPPMSNLPQVATYTSVQDAIDNSGKYFFWLGDLMYILLDCLYDVNDNKMRKHSENLNMRFIVGTVRVPDPADLTKTITINPLQIPIDMAFFSSWYHDTIIKKGVTSYPVGVFIKDLIERLINDVIYDTCFALLLPDENPPLLRSTFFTDHDANWFKTYKSTSSRSPSPGTWFDPLDPYDSSPIRLRSRKPSVLMKKDVSQPIKNAKNYCVIYQQMPSYFSHLKSSNNKPLSADPYCPTIFHGRNMTGLQYTDEITFSQQGDGSYLKEARFFQAQGGNLNLMSNVYDLSFRLIGPKIATIFYPGNIINFILTDFTGGSDKSIISLPYNYSKTQSDPHTRDTMAQILGMGGYHIVKSVTYTMNKEFSGENTKINIATKFIGTDAKNVNVRKTSTIPNANEPKVCVDIFNNTLDGLRITESATGVDAAEFNYKTTNASQAPTATDSVTVSRETEISQAAVSTPSTTFGQSTPTPAASIATSSTAKPVPVTSEVVTQTQKGAVAATVWFGDRAYKDWSVNLTSINDDTANKKVTINFTVTRADGSTYTDTAIAAY